MFINWTCNPNLGCGEEVFLPPCWFSLNYSELVKAVTLTFCRFQQHFINDVRAKFGIPYWCQSLNIGQDLDGGNTNFWISGQFLIKINCHNTRSSDYIGMKFGLVNKLEKKNKKTSKNFDDNLMSKSCDVIAIFQIYDQFGAIRKPDSKLIVSKIYIFINSNLFS